MNTCQSCKFFSALHNQCRERSPVPFFAGVQPTGQPAFISVFPATNKDDWCGQYQPEISKAN